MSKLRIEPMKNPDKIINYWKKEKFVVACIIIFGLSFNSSMINHELLELQDKAIKANILENSMQPIYNVIAMLGIIIVIYMGGTKVINGDWTIGVFSTYIAIFTAMAVKASKAAKLFNSVQKSQFLL